MQAVDYGASFFVDNAINQREQGEIKQMLQKAHKILICTPLYVVLGADH